MLERDWHHFDRSKIGTALTARRARIALTCGYNDLMGDGGVVVHSLAHMRVTDLRPSPRSIPFVDPWADVFGPQEGTQ